MPKLLESTVTRITVPAGKRDVLIFDDTLPGFGIRKFASGKASFFVKYQIASQQRKITLGPVIPGVTAEMRRKASDILAKARLGQDVAGEKRAARGKKVAPVGDLVQRYLDARKSEVASAYYIEITRYLQRHWNPLLSYSIEGVSRRNIVERLDEVAAEHGKVAADRAKDAISTFFAWAIDKSYIDASPVHHIKRRATAGSRTRVLNESELVDVWNACAEDDYGRIVRLLILTGQRKSEVSDLSWAEIDLHKKQMDLPSERTKNRLPHIVPLSDEALAIIHQVRARHNREYMFGEGHRGFQGWSRAKKSLDARIAKVRGEFEKKPLPGWTLHDIRRSVNTHLNENSIAAPHVIEAIMNHVSGHKAGVAGVYNKSAYAVEKRQALEKWSCHLQALLAIHSSEFK